MKTILKIEQIIGLVQFGLSSGKALFDAVTAGKIAVQNAAGQEMTAEDVRGHIIAAQTKALEVGDAAAGRIEGRHQGEG